MYNYDIKRVLILDFVIVGKTVAFSQLTMISLADMHSIYHELRLQRLRKLSWGKKSCICKNLVFRTGQMAQQKMGQIAKLQAT